MQSNRLANFQRNPSAYLSTNLEEDKKSTSNKASLAARKLDGNIEIGDLGAIKLNPSNSIKQSPLQLSKANQKGTTLNDNTPKDRSLNFENSAPTKTLTKTAPANASSTNFR